MVSREVWVADEKMGKKKIIKGRRNKNTFKNNLRIRGKKMAKTMVMNSRKETEKARNHYSFFGFFS